METFPSSYCNTLHDIIMHGAKPQKKHLFTLDMLVTGFEMTELYNLYLYQTLQFRSRPRTKSHAAKLDKQTVILSRQNQSTRIEVSLDSFATLIQGDVYKLQIEEIKVIFDNIDLDANDSCHCRVYFNYNNAQLNSMLFFDANITADCTEIVIDLH
eukprot:267115_1